VRADYLSEITRDTAFAQNEKADRQSCGLAKGQSVTASDRSELDDSSRMMITGGFDYHLYRARHGIICLKCRLAFRNGLSRLIFISISIRRPLIEIVARRVPLMEDPSRLKRSLCSSRETEERYARNEPLKRDRVIVTVITRLLTKLLHSQIIR
jgi:hypothetical protein